MLDLYTMHSYELGKENVIIVWILLGKMSILQEQF